MAFHKKGRTLLTISAIKIQNNDMSNFDNPLYEPNGAASIAI